jgi:hypothetical protein
MEHRTIYKEKAYRVGFNGDKINLYHLEHSTDRDLISRP